MENTQLVACAILQDGIRTLFLEKKPPGTPNAPMELSLPSAFVKAGQDPVSALSIAVREQTGIDCQIGEISAQAKYNAGSKKHKRVIPLLIFSASAKNFKCTPSSEFLGCQWLPVALARKQPLAKNAHWLKT